MLGFLLDAKIRKATNGTKSLDDVMRTAYQRFAGARGYTPADFRGVVEQVAGTSMKAFWETSIEGTAELDYAEALDAFGLRFRPSASTSRPWLGITTRNDAGRLLVSQVRRDGPGSKAGLNVDDEILAIDDFRVRADRLEDRLQQYRAGDKVTLWYASGNYDEDKFADPYRLDLGRQPNRHLTFGLGGPHFCLGAHLAKLEVKIWLEEMIPYLDRIELAGPPTRLRSNFFNGIKRLPVQVRS